MKSPVSDPSKSVRVNSKSIQDELSQLIVSLEATTRRVTDGRFRKIAMKSTEVLKGLRTLFQRLESEDEMATRNERSDSDARDAKASGSSLKMADKQSAKSNKKSDKPAKQNRSSAPASGKNSTTKPGASSARASTQTRKTAATVPTPDAAAPAPSAPLVATPKPVDPDEIAAKAKLQQKEARAPQRPSGPTAPRPMPPQSGKPIWSKPHSS